jgi:hypothetical protein
MDDHRRERIDDGRARVAPVVNRDERALLVAQDARKRRRDADSKRAFTSPGNSASRNGSLESSQPSTFSSARRVVSKVA